MDEIELVPFTEDEKKHISMMATVLMSHAGMCDGETEEAKEKIREDAVKSAIDLYGLVRGLSWQVEKKLNKELAKEQLND